MTMGSANQLVRPVVSLVRMGESHTGLTNMKEIRVSAHTNHFGYTLNTRHMHGL